MYRLRYKTSSDVKRFPPYVLLITRFGGVGERAGGFLRLRTRVEGGAAGVPYQGLRRVWPHECTVNLPGSDSASDREIFLRQGCRQVHWMSQQWKDPDRGCKEEHARRVAHTIG